LPSLHCNIIHITADFGQQYEKRKRCTRKEAKRTNNSSEKEREATTGLI